MSDRTGGLRDVNPRPRVVPTVGGEPELPVEPRGYPGWTDPPLPGGPTPTTPGGYSTVQSGTGLHSETLVGPGHRVPILYGRCLISPDLVKAKAETASGVTRGRYHVVISEGPIDAIESWYGATSFESIVTTLGSLSPTAGMPSWAIGLAAANILTKATQPWFPRCTARGRTPYDPRLGAWGAGSYPDLAKCAYSTNPALIYLDVRVFPQFGCDWPKVLPSLVDWTSVAAAADHFDELVDGAKRYELNLYLQAAKNADEWLKTIELHAGLRWREEGGLYRLDYSAPVATVAAAITNDHIVKGTVPRWAYGSGAGLADRPNRFRAEWIDPASNWAIRTVEVRHPEVDAGAPIRDGQVYKLHGFHSEAMAQRALWRIAHEIWSEREFECELTTERLDLVEGSRVPVTLSSLGLSAAEHIVTRTGYDSDRVRITARRYDATTWTPDYSSSGALPGDSFFDTPPALTGATYKPRVDVSVEGTTTLTRERPGVLFSHPTFAYGRQLRIRCAIRGTNTPGTITGVTINDGEGGTGYTLGDPVTFGGEGVGATGHVDALGVSDAIGHVAIDTAGSGYYPQSTSASAGGTGTGAILSPQITSATNTTLLTWDDPEMARNEYLVPLVGNESQTDLTKAWAVLTPLVAAFDNTTPGDFFSGGTINGGWYEMRLMVLIESLAGLLGPASTFDQAANAYASTTTNTNEPVYHLSDLTANRIPKVNATGDGRLVDSKVTDDGTTLRYNGYPIYHEGAPQAIPAGIPVGSVVDYAGGTVPTDWLLCDGAAVSRTTYADLFTAIGTKHGAGDGTTTFNLPALNERFVLPTTTGATVGATGGGADHFHPVSGNTGVPSATRDIAPLATGTEPIPTYDHTHAVSITSGAGEGASGYDWKDILPPFIRLLPIIKALDTTSDAHTHAASAITFTPAGTISATNVQAAIEEVASEAGGGGGAALTVEEADGAPSVASVVKIKFAAGTTVTDDGAGVVTVTPPSGGGGTTPVFTTEAFTATAGQTAFVLANTPLSGGIAYVTRDGVVARSADWSLATATVTFGTGLDAGVEVQISYWRTVPTGTSPAWEGFVATAAQTDFTLAHVAGIALVVSLNGVVQASTAWSIVGGSTLTFVSGLTADDDVWISYLY